MTAATQAENEATQIDVHAIRGAIVYGHNGAVVGSVSHFEGEGEESRVILDVGRYVGLPHKLVPLRAIQLHFTQDRQGRLSTVTGWTREGFAAMPAYVAPAPTTLLSAGLEGASTDGAVTA